MYPTTGYWKPIKKTCPRCGHEHYGQLYFLCDECRDDDLIIADAQAFVKEREKWITMTAEELDADDWSDFQRTRNDNRISGYPV